MKVREHRGLLTESLLTQVEIEQTKEALFAQIQKSFKNWPTMWDLKIEDVTVEPYGYDDRIGWDTHIVLIKNYGVFGFTDHLV